MKEQALQKLISDLQNGDVRQRRIASYKLGKSQNPAVVPALIQASNDADSSVRQNVFDGLHNIGSHEALNFLNSRATSPSTTAIEQLNKEDDRLVIPMYEPYVCFDEIKEGRIITGIVKIKLPNHCAWSNKSQIESWKKVEVYEENPRYKSTTEMLVNKSIEVGATLAFGVAGNMIFKDNTIYPSGAENVKGITRLLQHFDN